MSTVTIKGKSFVVAALSLGDLRILTKEGHLGALMGISSGVMSHAQVEATIALVAASLGHSHPECTRDWVADNIDVGEAPECLRVVLEASGFVHSGTSPNVLSP